jgi:Sulfotransferase family/Aspartyl/Asparaginyl beta-hydroxylase
MRLAKPFYRLPVRFDAALLREEVSTLPASAWAKHPNEIHGNTSIRLVSAAGGENDEVNGDMLPTPHLENLPYLRQVLASLGVVWSRSRLLRLAPFAGVPQHADINYHWFYRVRLHIPIITRPEVRFSCGDDYVHMAAGEAWIFDNWRLHSVENPVDAERIHLVADTTGSAAFWRLVAQSESPNAVVHQHVYDPARETTVLTERVSLATVMPPAEVDLLLLDLHSELMAPPGPESAARLAHYHALLEDFRRDWRQLYLLFGEATAGWTEYLKLRDSLRETSRTAAADLVMKTNRVAAHRVLEGRLLRVVVSVPRAADAAAPGGARRGKSAELEQPIFIVSAPRAGSTLLFETLAASDTLCTLGGEAHWLVESAPALRPGAPGVESNRLTEQNYSPAIGAHIIAQIRQRAIDNRGRPVGSKSGLIFLEKTPKNALRIPFFDKIFPTARFIFLWRDPRENISSIIEAWRSGQWRTYNHLDGFDGPWSLLLPPGWRQMSGKPLEEIAAFQWDTANRIIMSDLQSIAEERWTVVNYGEFVSHPAQTARRLSDFAQFEFDAALASRVSRPLPLSRFTQTPPAPDKWHRNAAGIERILPGVDPTWRKLQAFQ